MEGRNHVFLGQMAVWGFALCIRRDGGDGWSLYDDDDDEGGGLRLNYV